MTMNNQKHLENITTQLQKALEYLEYSFKKVSSLPDKPAELDQESLETWESFTARFARVADIFMAKYLRARILEEDPAFRGTMRDFVNTGAKIGIIDDVEKWMVIRSLRNISAHEYSEGELREFFLQLKKYTPSLLELKCLV